MVVFRKINLPLVLMVLAIGLLVVMTGCSSTDGTDVAYSTTAPPALGPSPLPAASEIRFRVATTTSLYDTGLLSYLEPMFEEEAGVEMDIIYAGTGAALNRGRSGNVDGIIVHDPEQEKTFLEEGYGINKRSFAYNFFLIAGPADDPAQVRDIEPAAAFGKIAAAGLAALGKVRFVSRGDASGTHNAEKRLWAAAGYDYSRIESSGTWYVQAGQGMGPTLMMANELNAYVFCDGSTFMSYQGKLALVPLVRKASEATLNIYNVYAVNPEKIKTAKITTANKFINWLISPAVQELIGRYGTEKFGDSLFHPINDGGCIYPACPDLAENMEPVR